jgi:hypothetical protein
MSHKIKRQLTDSIEWTKQLRKFLKQQFWRGERKEGQETIKNQINVKNYS